MPLGEVNPEAVVIDMPAVLSGKVFVGRAPVATGGTSLTVQVKVSLVAAPFSSVAVTLTV